MSPIPDPAPPAAPDLHVAPVAPEARVTLRTFPTAAAIMRDDAGGTAAAVLAHAALESALAEMLCARDRVTQEPNPFGRWEHEGRPTVTAPAQSSSERAAARGHELHAWAAHEVRQAHVADAVRAYTHVLRGGGVPLAATLIAVSSAVRGHVTTRLSSEAGGAVQRDAARACLEAFFGP